MYLSWVAFDDEVPLSVLEIIDLGPDKNFQKKLDDNNYFSFSLLVEYIISYCNLTMTNGKILNTDPKSMIKTCREKRSGLIISKRTGLCIKRFV